jgi:hypothetical protein
MFIFLLALGEDYNILVMTRIREEAGKRPLRQAVVRAVGATGPTVTSAGLVLAGTFAVLAVVGGAGRATARSARSVSGWPSGSCSTPSWCGPCSFRRRSRCSDGGTGGRRHPVVNVEALRWVTGPVEQDPGNTDAGVIARRHQPREQVQLPIRAASGSRVRHALGLQWVPWLGPHHLRKALQLKAGHRLSLGTAPSWSPSRPAAMALPA